MKINEFISTIETIFPPAYQESYDNAGIQIYSGNDEIEGCLVTLDVTENVVEEAYQKKCNLILSHHPLIFGHGLMRIAEQNYTQRIVSLCIKKGISVYSAHTNADAVMNGTLLVMCQKLNINNYKLLKPSEQKPEIFGSGAIGILEKPISSQEFLYQIKQSFKCPFIRHTQIISDTVTKIALCPGSGSFLLNDAIKQKADVFISGDFTYHKFFDADKKILLVDIGHFESEIGIKQIFNDIVQKKFVNFVVQISEENTNPIKYL
ncbi:MAG: Nif3-like dinuclear metal center hexameric protein [Bacteroidales bacterium]|nr:Nif3-like dinuclear metal center hexameric protein [Bacteroidales bacterium]